MIILRNLPIWLGENSNLYENWRMVIWMASHLVEFKAICQVSHCSIDMVLRSSWTISASYSCMYLTLLDFEQLFYNHCNIFTTTVISQVESIRAWGQNGWWRRVGRSGRVTPPSGLFILAMSYSTSKYLEVLLSTSSTISTLRIVDPCLPCSVLHGSYCLSCKFKQSEKLTLEKQTSQSSLVMALWIGSVWA